jgi:hypothetical protein
MLTVSTEIPKPRRFGFEGSILINEIPKPLYKNRVIDPDLQKFELLSVAK